MKKMNKLVALLLAAVMVLGMMPTVTAHAYEHAAEVNGIDEYPAIELEATTAVNVNEAGYIAYFTFTPEVTDQYHFYSSLDSGSYSDTYGSLYDAEMNLLDYNDDASYGNALNVSSPNFCISRILEAGVTYVLAARLYSSGATGSFYVTLTNGHNYTAAVTKEPTCTEDGVMTYTCTYCGESYDEPIPAAHTWGDDGKCAACGETYLITGVCGDDLTWTLDWFGNMTISGTGNMYDYFYSWDGNQPSPWYDNYNADIVSVVVGEGCTSLGDYAFYQCSNMTTITMPSTLTEIGTKAIYDTGLTTLTVPDSVTTLTEGAFASNYNLVEATLPSGLTTIPNSCFAYCGALSKVVWPAAATSVGDNAFYNCNLSDLVVPEGVAYIGQYAFGGNGNMTKLTLPSTLAEVAAYAFSSCWNTTDFIFTGNAPVIGNNAFSYINANVWYPRNNSTWTEDIMQQYGGTLTWKSLCASHTFGEWTTIPATCETGEYQTRSCAVCGWTESTPKGEPLGHDFVYTVHEPNCATYEYGYTEITCTRCDYYGTENWVWPKHDYEVTVIEATCTTNGYTVYTCTRCGSYYTDSYVYATGHVVESWSEPTEATCTEPSVRTGTCSVCGETATEEVSPALGHTWGEDPVLNEDGSETYTCTVCGATYRTEGNCLYLGDNDFSITGGSGRTTKTFTAEQSGKLTITTKNMVYHNKQAYDNGWTDQYWQELGISWCFSEGFFNVYINNVNTGYTSNGDHEVILNSIDVNAGDVVTIEVNHLNASYYYSNDVKCTMNLALEAAHEHSYTAEVTEPTCTEGGYTTYTCACGDSYVADETAALGHDYVVTEVVDPTCTKSGYSVYTCTRCGKSYKDNPVEPAHAWDEGTVTAPTCTELGYTTYKCTVCGFEYVDEASWVDALGHDFFNGACTRCDAVKDATFTDVPVGSFFFDPVEWAVEKGITTGATETTFNPNGDLQRAQVVVMLWRAAGEPVPTTTVNPFTDVKETDFFYNAVLWAVEKGITTGTSATTFTPYGVTNRAQAVTFLWRYLGEPESTATNTFTDVEAGLWYEAPINWAVENEITNGMGDGTFGINTNCNRAHMVTFMYRAMVD